MAVESKMPPSKQIRNFLFVIGGGMLVGLLVVVALVQYYKPPGYYVAKNVLVSPDVLEKMWHTSPNRVDHQRLAFTGIEYLYFDKDTQALVSKTVSIDLYKEFYQLVGSDMSEEKVDDRIINLFEVDPPASLLIKALTDGTTQFRLAGGVFQQVDFAADGNHYRVQLQEEDPQVEWAYFKHEDILRKTEELLTQ